MRYLAFILLVFVLSFSEGLHAQCGGWEVCNANAGLYSNDDATTIAYDNMGCAFHAAYIKEPNGGWKAWGAGISANGTDALSPISITTANYPVLTGTIYKIAIGSTAQLIVLTSTGIFAGQSNGGVLNASLTPSAGLNKITVNGKTDGLPLNISPNDVKMLFATSNSLLITTCSGEVYALSLYARGNGGTGSEMEWYQVLESASTPLTNVIVTRGTTQFGFALKSDGTIWTWGSQCLLGNNTGVSERLYATEMVLPAGIPGIKMIQATSGSYFVLGTDKKVYSLGRNQSGQLGDNTVNWRFTWVNAKNPDDSIITDAAWISANEHDNGLPAFGLIKTGGMFYTCGSNSYGMIGRDPGNTLINYIGIPDGIENTDIITFGEVGGHSTALIKIGSPRYGYVGHRINGSMGDGTATIGSLYSFNFVIPPIVAVCGTLCAQPTLTTNSPICLGGNAIFTITGAPGDIITYNINNGTSQNVTISPTGSAAITINNPQTTQTINLTYVLGGAGSCSNNLSLTAAVNINTNVTASFTQVSPICAGFPIDSLPLISDNGITGTWSPAINNIQTTTYTFTPTGSCSIGTTMTIVVYPSNLIPQIAPICSGGSINLPTTSDNGIPGTWSPAINNLVTTTYTFTPIVNSCAAIVTMTVLVISGAVPIFTPITDICEGETLAALPLISTNGVTGSWSPVLNNMQTTTYTFTPLESCSVTTQMTIVVNPKINPVFSAVNPICYGEQGVILPAFSNNGISGSWSPAFNNLQTTAYTFTPNVSECANQTSMQIEVYEDFDFLIDKFCQNGNLNLYVNPNNFTDYNWQFNHTTVSHNAAFDVTAYMNSAAIESMPLTFEVTVTDANGCERTKSIEPKSIYCDIQRGISPDGDALNDFFDLRLLDVSHLSIFNRYGIKVFSKNNYRDEWHGQTDDGTILPDGVYYYVIDFNSEPSKTGWIYINNKQ